ncbi:MAG TPA: GNAT family N-acetyltransferase [Cellvibrio sp.]|nr:GNAT family N-acetyltransferase [Cellvibrio sp.]
MIIRELQKNDLNQLLLLYEHLHNDDVVLPEESKIQNVWSEILSNPNYYYFGGFIENQLVSSCTLTVIANLTRGCAPYGLIENVVTHSKHRNKGFGKAILAYALGTAWSANCYKVMLLTGRKDPATLKFYQSAGFNGDEKHAFIAKPKRQ